MFSSSRVLCLSLWFPYTLPECLPVVPLSNTCHMTTFVLVDFMEKLHMDKAGRNFQFSCSVVSDSLWPRGLQYARLPCPSPTLLSPTWAYSNSCPLSRWCHPTISPSDVPFASCLQLFPVSGSFPMSQFFAKVLGLQLQHQSFQWIFRVDFL